MVLNLKPADVGETDDSKILALVMDTGMADAAYSLIATADGSASLYFSNGGGIIGAGGHPQGAATAKALLAEAAGFLTNMTPAKDAPLITPGMTAFHVVTGRGLFTVSAQEVDFGEGRHPVSPLFHKAHELIAVIRWIDENRPPQPQNS